MNGMCNFRASISSIFVVIHLSGGFAFVFAYFPSYNDYRDDNIDYLLIHYFHDNIDYLVDFRWTCYSINFFFGFVLFC